MSSIFEPHCPRCGAEKFRDKCSCGALACQQRCGEEAEVHAIDPHPGGWGGRYCRPCAKALGFMVTDILDRNIA